VIPDGAGVRVEHLGHEHVAGLDRRSGGGRGKGSEGSEGGGNGGELHGGWVGR
jgi:hypothetical protein